MERRKASDFPPEVLKLFDGYVHGTMSRRGFLDGAAGFHFCLMKAMYQAMVVLKKRELRCISNS